MSRALGREVVRRVRVAGSMLRPRRAARSTWWWVRSRHGARSYRHLTEDELRATRTSGTVFVLGSGKSILDIPADRWRAMEQFQTVSFSQFARQEYVRADYHVHGEVFRIDEYARRFHENPRYASTIHVVQEGWPAHMGNELIARRLLPLDRPVFRYRRTARAAYAAPSRRFSDGLVHGWNSSISVTNFALLMGWRRIVLVGVDLYDREYFWTPRGVRREDEEPFLEVDDRFLHAERIASVFARWRPIVAASGAEILVYNPRSILANALDVFTWQDA